jgi:uncharacterized protein (TIGR00725 family)
MELRERPRIGVMGPSTCPVHVQDLAYTLGRLIAEAGGLLICGGGTGAMEAAARGAREEGGITVGILPGPTSSEANPYIDIPIVTDLGNARNVINILTSQVVIAVGGAAGTLSEIALALKCGTPVIGLETWGLVPPQAAPAPAIRVAQSPEEAVRLAFELVRHSGR